jgi:hypothetical protein
MFPPAARPLEAAIAAYERDRAGANGWMLGAFVVSSEQVGPLDTAVHHRRNGASASTRNDTWPVCVTLRTESPASVEEVWRSAPSVDVIAMEFAPVDNNAIRALAAAVPAGVSAFFEVLLDETMDERLDVVAAHGALAKVRTGGIRQELFPPVESVARFLRACAERRLPCKATAGLHHALAGTYALTYASDSDRGSMLGFLNVSLAAAIALEGASAETVIDALRDAEPEAIAFDDAGLEWRGHRVSTSALESMRTRLFRSFGSCSFHEPVDELARLHLL